MTDQADQELAIKKRIIKHMNTDHHDSITRYLRHFAHLPSWQAHTGTLTDISLTHLTLHVPSTPSTPILIPFNPPMKTYREARDRVVDLDKLCRKALNQSDVTITTYIPPTVNKFYMTEFLIITMTFLFYSRRSWFLPSGFVAQYISSSLASFSYAIQPWIFWGMLSIHTAEMAYFALWKLPRYSLNMRMKEFWFWTLSGFVEGGFAFWRFDEMVRVKREKERH